MYPIPSRAGGLLMETQAMVTNGSVKLDIGKSVL